MERLQAEWPTLVAEIGEAHGWLRTDLLDSWPVEMTDSTCSLGFDPEFAGEIEEPVFHRRRPITTRPHFSLRNAAGAGKSRALAGGR